MSFEQKVTKKTKIKTKSLLPLFPSIECSSRFPPKPSRRLTLPLSPSRMSLDVVCRRAADFLGALALFGTSRLKVCTLQTADLWLSAAIDFDPSGRSLAAESGGAGWLRGPDFCNVETFSIKQKGRPLEPDAGNADAGRSAVLFRQHGFIF